MIALVHLDPKKITMLEYASVNILPGHILKRQLMHAPYNLEKHFLIYYFILKLSKTQRGIQESSYYRLIF